MVDKNLKNHILKILFFATLEEFNLNLESAIFRNLPLDSARIPSSFFRFSLKYRRLFGKKYLLNTILLFIVLLYLAYFIIYFILSLVHKFFTNRIHLDGEVYAYTEFNHNIDFILNDLTNVKYAVVRPSYNPLVKFQNKNLHSFKGISCYALITYEQIFFVLYLSIYLVYYLIKKQKYYLLFYSFFYSSWLTYYFSLEKKTITKLWFSDQIDKWSILCSNIRNVKLNMVQHGSLYALDSDGGIRYYEMKYKHRKINTVYCLNDIEKILFIKYILRNNIKPAFLSIITNYKTYVAPVNNFSILILGHKVIHEFIKQLLIINRNEKLNATFLYRPHPNELPLTKNIFSESVIITDTNNMIPKVDLLLNYGSTLAHEIIKIQSPIVIHYEPQNINEPQKVFNLIKKYIV
jgi:hypothetical protein